MENNPTGRPSVPLLSRLQEIELAHLVTSRRSSFSSHSYTRMHVFFPAGRCEGGTKTPLQHLLLQRVKDLNSAKLKPYPA